MIPNAAVQHRGKHFNLLLTRELALIQREHEQNLITHKKLERSIRRDNDRTMSIHGKKISVTPVQKKFYIRNDESSLSIVSSSINNYHDRQNLTDGKQPRISPRFYRHCFKGQRLPPIVKLNRRKQNHNDWIDDLQPKNVQKENISEQWTLINESSSKVTLPELTPIQKQIHLFMDTLPKHKGLQKGFDNFGPASLYSHPAPVAMR
jgi:hypothetical protein